MYRLAICDDESVFLMDIQKLVRSVLKEIGAEFTITAFTDPKCLLNELKQEPDKYHMLLLDIIMDQLNGVDAAKYIRKLGSTASILFVTVSRDYCMNAYSVYPIHYLLKPLKRQQLLEVINKDYRSHFLPKHIMIPSKHENLVFSLDEILCIEAINRMIIVHTKSKDIKCSGILKEWSEKFPENLFIRCHKSYIVNLSKVAGISTRTISLCGGSEIPVGRAYSKSTLHALMNYLDLDQTEGRKPSISQ